MSPHFTYSDGIPGEDLRQGDILQRSCAVNELLAEVHPHYHKSTDYKYLIVMTQSCDLVRRGSAKKCKARYISVAAVRPLATALSREFHASDDNDEKEGGLWAEEKGRSRFHDFVMRLLNNNAEGYFYLHNCPHVRISEPVVAFLRLSIALKAELHYATCVDARVAQLRTEFQAKLGWLVGNLYSRVGTQDWPPGREFQKLVKDTAAAASVIWMEKSHMDRLRKENCRSSDVPEQLEKWRKEESPAHRRLQFFEHAVDQVVSAVRGNLAREKIVRRLMNDPKLKDLFR